MSSNFFIRITLYSILLLLVSLACNAVTGFFEEESEPYLPEETVPSEPPTGESTSTEPSFEDEPQPDAPSTAEALLCPEAMDNIVEAATNFQDDETDDEDSEFPEQLYLVSYGVYGDQISDPIFEDVSADLTAYQEDEITHQEIWDIFITLIPSGEHDSLVEYDIVTDGEGNNLASVGQTYYDPALWTLEVDILDSNDKLDLIYTLIHEYAHLLTLGPDQVTPSLALFKNPDDNEIYFNEVSACPAYFPGEGCSKTSSYINTFYNQFWADIYEEWLDINLIEEDDAYYEALDDFYYEYEDRFVTDYAATNPEEDIAEVFTFFVLSPRPGGSTIAEEKILFLYEYPELVELRDEIINGICSLNP
jgi:hypothetical protein